MIFETEGLQNSKAIAHMPAQKIIDSLRRI